MRNLFERVERACRHQPIVFIPRQRREIADQLAPLEREAYRIVGARDRAAIAVTQHLAQTVPIQR